MQGTDTKTHEERAVFINTKYRIRQNIGEE